MKKKKKKPKQFIRHTVRDLVYHSGYIVISVNKIDAWSLKIRGTQRRISVNICSLEGSSS